MLVVVECGETETVRTKWQATDTVGTSNEFILMETDL